MILTERIKAGEFDPPAHPRVPVEPQILRVIFAQLTPGDLMKRDAARREYDARCAAYRAETAACITAWTATREKFRLALCAEYAIPPDDPFGRRMYAIAVSNGEQSGCWDELAAEFRKLLPLWELHRTPVAVSEG